MSEGVFRLRFQSRWIFASPLLAAACFGAMGAAVVLARALSALREAHAIRREMEDAAVRLAVEQAAIDYVASTGACDHSLVNAGGGIEVSTIANSEVGSHILTLAAQVGQREASFTCPLLPGVTPPVLGLVFAVADDAPTLPSGWPHPAVVARADLPRLGNVPASRFQFEPLSMALHRDGGIALLTLAAGTDREDFVLSAAAPLPGGLVHVPGNLWIEAGAVPMRLLLSDDVTFVVEGNVYLGRSVETVGAGRLTIVSEIAGGVPFADRDGNGRFSPGDVVRGSLFEGPLEGGGNVYLGLPRAPCTALSLKLSLLVGGELHLATDRASVLGSILLCHGGTVLPSSRGMLAVLGYSDPRGERVLLPGFVAVGSPRPGCLRRSNKQTLYPVAPVR